MKLTQFGISCDVSNVFVFLFVRCSQQSEKAIYSVLCKLEGKSVCLLKILYIAFIYAAELEWVSIYQTNKALYHNS